MNGSGRPLLVICGRPNVGKSTLFNRWVKRRKALVHATPGMTRDRLAEEMGGYTIMDTGGVETLSKDILSQAIVSQARTALDESTLILFLVDGVAGIHPLDEDLSLELHRLGAPVFLVVNKMDTNAAKEQWRIFTSLGWERIFPISAEHGIGFETLKEEVESFLNVQEHPAEWETAIKIAVVGKPNVGKSSLVNTLAGLPRLTVSEIPGTTRDAVDVRVERGGRSYLFIDTAGMRRKKSVKDGREKLSIIMSLKSIRRAEIACLMLDGSDDISHQDLEIASAIQEAKRGMVILVNKSDLIESGAERERIRETIRERFKVWRHVPVLFISAKTGKGINKLWPTLDRTHTAYYHRISTGVLNRLFRDFSERLPRKKLKVYYITQVGVAPPTFVLVANRSASLREDHLRFLANRLREEAPFDGVPLKFIIRARGEERR